MTETKTIAVFTMTKIGELTTDQMSKLDGAISVLLRRRIIFSFSLPSRNSVVNLTTPAMRTPTQLPDLATSGNPDTPCVAPAKKSWALSWDDVYVNTPEVFKEGWLIWIGSEWAYVVDPPVLLLSDR